MPIPQIAKTVTVAGIPIDIAQGPIGICLSGGADSSLLLYILMTHTDQPIHAFTCGAQKTLRATARASQQVLHRCMELTGNINVTQHTWFVEKNNNRSALLAMPRQFMELQWVNSVYLAETANPQLEQVSQFHDGALMHDIRDPLVQRQPWEPDGVYVPWTMVNKQGIASMYRELNLMQSLFPVTRSCNSKTCGYGHCGACWFCSERQWGFGCL